LNDQTSPEDAGPAHTILVRHSGLGGRSDGRTHYLVVVDGLEPGRRVELRESALRIGRTEPCELVLPDPGISRTHCRIENRFGEIVVTDLGSTNGTFVDGRKVAGTTRLPVDSTLQVGEQVLRHEFRDRKEIEDSRELDRDLEKARLYVQSMLPEPWSSGPILTEWMVLPSTQLGGDALGHHALDDQRYALYLVDVSGHGAGAAMHTVSVMNVLRHHALPRIDFGEPAEVLQGLNAMFDMDQHGGMYFTIWYGVYDTRSRMLRYSSGGHHPAFLVPPARSEAIPLHTRNMAVGTFPGYEFKSGEIEVPPDYALYLFSDGVFEIVTAEGNEWRLQEFLPLLLQPPAASMTEPRRLHEAVAKVSGRDGFDDDFSMLVARFQ